MQTSTGLQGQQAYVYSGADISRWSLLKTYVLDPNAGFSTSSVSLNLQDYYNFFILNPTAIKLAFTIDNSREYLCMRIPGLPM